LEKRYGIEFLDVHWMGRSDLTLNGLIDVIAQAPRRAKQRDTPHIARRPRSVQEALRTMGIVRGSRWLAGRLVARIGRAVYEREAYAVLSLSLGEKALPHDPPGSEIEVRAGSLVDGGALGDLYPSSRLKEAAKVFAMRMHAGYFCLMAWHGTQPVGVDWIAPSAHVDSLTGLVYRMSPGTCCGVDLYEHRDWGGRGVGLTLLLASLRESEGRGFRRQVSVVNEANLRMLAASMQLIGFKQVGSIRTHRVLRRPFSTWRLGTERGRGGDVAL
jgi:GNAT superfamily N-acetyltransferase